MLVDANTIFPDGSQIDHKLNNSDRLMAGINMNTNTSIWLVCSNKHSWKSSLSKFSEKPFCPECGPKPHNFEQSLSLKNERLPSTPKLVNFIQPISFLKNEITHLKKKGNLDITVKEKLGIYN